MDNSIGKRIADIREAQGMTQTDLAKKIKTTQSAIARLESGTQNITTEMLRKISSALGKNLVTLSPGSMNVVIEGKKKLTGTIETNTSKNGAVGLLCASLLNRGVTTLHRMPRIEEVHRILEVLESIGMGVTWNGSTVTLTPPKKYNLKTIDVEAARKTRSIVMFIGALVHTLPQFSLPQSGGCKLGSRTVRPHFYALEHYGIDIETTNDAFKVTYEPKSPSEIILYESGDTVTENVLFAAARHTGTTTIKYCSANYMVQEICVFLQRLGVTIEGLGTTTLTVTGVDTINTNIEYTLAEDPTDSMFFIAAAIATNSTITITRCPIEFLELELLVLEKMGLEYTKSKLYLGANGQIKLADLKIKQSKLHASPEKVHSRPYPGLNADNLPFFAIIATQATGQTLIHDWMYEKRAIYFTELEKLGADTVLADPHRIYITGPTALRATELICPPALRPATILLIAMLGAQGRSVLRNIYSINRGYENLVARLQSLGANINYLEEL
ncbi:MAG: UDP-N-acetylglucosamine 1-carboxyvinyltransferase [Candidatus Pacebacteria bacterium]|jgi:UDP-N-acetylglucosamine 1-carboxyvinyltransferase|nr:UDP-N-acetylglucosamine 1-carboxyvinyltransferase [Candidatus Paceibacterota bacterium]